MSFMSRLKLKPTQKLSLKPIYLVTGGLSFAIIITLILVNTLGVQQTSVANAIDYSRYSFDVAAPSLEQVNFTVLESKINSKYDEVRPLISPDGKTLYFSRRFYPDNTFGKKDYQDIWMTVLTSDEQWSDPKNMGVKINSKFADAICSISPDGTEILLINDDLTSKNPLLRSRKFESGWSMPIPTKIENFHNDSEYMDFYKSYETNVLLMAISGKNTKGDQDLYVSLPIDDDSWSEPKHLGPMINSDKADFAPFLAADGRTLFFVSYGHKGFGGCDIFRSVRQDDSWDSWSKPENLGEGINSPREESYFSITSDFKYIYFETYDSKKQVRDIFRADLPEIFKPI